MPENILVVEYEPRYAERVRLALTGQPFEARFAKDGEEAMRALDDYLPKLIVLSSVVPKVSAPELIRAIRGRNALQQTPILLTVSGYTGNAPKQDAVRMGASDILPKPYSESEFLGKVQQMLGVGQLTSSQIFGDLLHDETVLEATVTNPGVKKPMNPKDDVDKMLEQTLAGVMGRKKDASAKPKTAPGTSDLDKRLQDTLSGLEKSARRTAAGTTPVPKPVPVPDVAPASDGSPPAKAGAPSPIESVPISQPIIQQAAPAPAPKVEEEEPTDGVRFGQYVLLEKIATGGMAEVWKARMRGVEGFQKIVAIKKILPHLSDNQEFIEMFVDEAKLAAQLNHNNIIHIYDLGKIASSYYIAMEYVDGHDLKTILKRAQERDHPVGPEIALFVASKVAAALDYAHRRRDFDQKELGLVHRDVSPQNVLISQEGDIKLCDFGIAKAASKASHTQAGALKGKLQYMSPEQASGKPIDRRSDIFALAAVLFEMLTAKKLFTGENEISILDQVREARITPPSKLNDEVTPDIDRVVLKALEKDPAQRYQTAGELARDIDSILYNMKPTPTSADLAIYMHRLWSEEPVVHHRVEEPERTVVDEVPDLAAAAPPPKPAPVPVIAAHASAIAATTAPGNVVMPAWDAPRPATKAKKSAAVPLSIAALLVAGVIGGFFYFRSRGASAPAPAAGKPAAAATANTPAPSPVTTTQPAAAVDTSATAAATTMAPQPPALDQAAVNIEVQKRLAAERTRLEQQSQARTQPQPASTASSAPPPVRRPVESQPVTQTVAPPPVQNTQTQAPPPATATQAPPTQTAAADTAPAAPRVREGDLVAAGTEGLVPARVLRRGSVPYPAIARAQRIEGTVILSVLVSEAGQVLDLKVVRGRPAGLNEAAEQIIRRSTFAPPTKDGVRVKAWTTVPVDFKL
ncbi:MAG TPA: TonB family protein [Thermoanaerobaculia bacterium]|nr:TonB family protein [Thermoanaerobaculia bacterium]